MRSRSCPQPRLRAYPAIAGYSDQALRLREAILTEACQVLSSRELKATYDAAYQMGRAGERRDGCPAQALRPRNCHPSTCAHPAPAARAGDIDVSLDQLPGALVLLHEVGELEVVMELGDTLLKVRRSLLGLSGEFSTGFVPRRAWPPHLARQPEQHRGIVRYS